MKEYLDLLKLVLNTGQSRPTRAILKSTGESVHAISLFGIQTKYNLENRFPLVTTKQVSFSSITHELLWFLSGSTNVKYLQKNKVAIWDEWCDENGELGPIYGKQWRDFGGIDQISNLIEDIKKVINNPFHSMARRLIISAWNPPDIPKMALPPCHLLAQFYVNGNKLDCQFYQRSADMFLGVPYNIASYALLTYLLARSASLSPGTLTHVIGDAHIYSNHIEQVKVQLSRQPLSLPQLSFRPSAPLNLLEIKMKDILIIDYWHQGILKGEVAI